MRNVIVIFADDVSHIFENCKDFEYVAQFGMFYVNKNGSRIMIPRERVLFIGFEENVYEPDKGGFQS